MNIYSPNATKQESYDTINQTLQINKNITGICFGNSGSPVSTADLLYIGSETNLMCYNLKENKTLFNKEIMEGVYVMVTGLYSNYKEPLCIVGGNCSVTGITKDGEDKFWTVLSGNAVCMALADTNGDGLNELLVGTDDYTIRFYQNESVIFEINENTKIIQVEFISQEWFAYALENGTVGVYKDHEKKWKRKEKGNVSDLIAYDFNSDKENELLIGWSTGKISLTNTSIGSVLYEFDLNAEISKMFYTSFGDNKEKHLVILTTNGEVSGYKYSNIEEQDIFTKEVVSNTQRYVAKDKHVNNDDINKLNSLYLQKKLILENLEDLAIKDSNKTKKNSPKDEIVLPKNTEIKIDLNSNKENKCADLIIESSPEGTVIHSVIIMSEQIYKGESYVKFPSRETNKVVIQIKTKKDMQINLHIKVLVGKSYYLHDYQIFEYNKIIPKYCFYILLRDEIEYKDELIQGVSFPFNERIERLILWIEMNLNISKKELESFKIGETEYKIRFNSLRTDKILQISVKDNTLSIFTEEIELAGNILQDMFEYFKLKEFNTSINYTEVVKSFTSTIDNIQRLDNERNQYNINMTEIITFIKDLYVRAEDNRLIDNIQNFKDYFRKINLKNMELLDEFEKRSARFEELINDLKKINEIIMTFSNLKVGRFKNEIVNQCRNCIRKKNYKLLIKIISTGGE